MILPPAALGPKVEIENPLRGALFIVLAFFLVACMSALGKISSALSPIMISFFQSSISFLLLLPWFLKSGPIPFKTFHFGLHFVRAIAGLASQVLMFLAIRKMPLMNAVLLSNSAPLFIPLVAGIWLHEKSSKVTWISLMIGFLGIVLILKPSRALFENPSSALATLAAVFSSIALVSVKRLSASDPVERILFYYFLISSLVSAMFLPLEWQPPNGSEWLCLLAIGVCMTLSQLLIIAAYRYAKPSILAPYNYSVVIFSAILGWGIWHTLPKTLGIVGACIVCFSGVISTRLNRHGDQIKDG